jgi:hypothetical protein
MKTDARLQQDVMAELTWGSAGVQNVVDRMKLVY